MNQLLLQYIDTLNIPERLKRSTKYSINAGGKRLRPILMRLTCEGLQGDCEKIYPAAVALEMIHTYSLIHDDLPAMDDDMYRRGKLTNHRQFDEATAILAGDGLLTNSFQVIASANVYNAEEKVYLINRLTEASGMEGMVGGQLLDMEAEQQEITIEQLEQIHRLKTGCLLSFAIDAGSYLAGANDKTRFILRQFAEYIGLIFQIQDDILDVVGDQHLMGKASGSDQGNSKSTYPSVLGLDGAISHKKSYVNKAKQCLEQAGLKGSRLEGLTDYLSERDL
ncbi:geranyl transferase [Gracilibacillus dipsosauri]|uniref:Farnesyl diphosphate synthase n=3 Tax=Gracilibacillus TaxID=74385 RepID=A0A317L0E9_9BACI|nr:geranyl transferase [Gracilibacillus dipsosauri]